MTTALISSISFLRINTNRCRRLLRIKSHFGSRASLSSLKDELSSTEEAKLSLDDYEASMEEQQEAEKLEELHNISGLTPEQYRIYHGKPPILPFKNVDRKRRLYAKYGSASGEDPRIMWPSKQEILDMIEHDKEEEVPLHEKIARLQAERGVADKERLERHKMIEKNMAQMSKWIAEYQGKVRDAEKQVKMRREKKEALLDEARDYFGYRVKINDPKFQQMIDEKEAKERKELKERKKKERARKLAERLKEDVILMGLNPEDDKTS